ncbi:WD40-repeat-containing domain protein [Lactarius indigo]|nr:WD40-repeat-containing domain protein [Lactarius indigo]
MSQSPRSDTVEFTLQNTLRGHTKAINHLAVSPDKTRLISIGDDSRTVVWSVASGEKLFAVERPFNGPATAVSWASRDNSRFVVGFASGDLHLFWSESEKSYSDNIGVSGGKGPVEGIVYNPIHDRIASICADSTQLWRIKGSILAPVLSSPFEYEGYGKCVQFCDNGASVVMYYLDTHECGYATPNHDSKLLLVSNLKDGIDEYQFPSMEKVQTFTHPIEKNCILQTKTLPLWNLIVAGGDDGFARVFNRISGQLVSEIHHGVHGQQIQVVEAFANSGNRCMVITASSGRAPYELKVWSYQPEKVRHDESPQSPAVNETARPFQTVDEMEAEAVERQLRVEDPRMDSAVTPGGLPKGLYTDIVNAASDAATVATLRALQNGTLKLPRRARAPPSHDPSISGGNESETGDLQVFKPPAGKKRVPRPNEDKLIDEAMRKFLESGGVLATKDYIPDDPDEGRVKAYEEHGLLGPDPSAPRICLKQTFRGKWNKEVVEMLATNFILAVKKGTYKPVQHTWLQMNEDKVRKRCQSKLYRTQRICLNPKNGPESDKINRMYQRRQETYYRRRKIHNANYHNDPATWNNVTLLLDALGTLGTSDDETDNDSEHLNPDPRFKSVRRVDIGFLNPAIAKIWAAVESYPSSLRPSRGNRAFKRIVKAKSISKNRAPLPGLPVNFYNPQWLQASPARFQRGVKAEVPLPVLVLYNVDTDYEDDDVEHMEHDGC